MYVPSPIAVGLAGAGPWAAKAHAPMLAAGPETRLAGVWSPGGASAAALAAAHGVPAASSFDALLECCDAVAFAIPPDAQAELAVRAARAGKALLLDKPLSLGLAAAERLADEAGRAGVVTQLMLTHRYRRATREFLERARDFGAIGARVAFVSGAFVRGPYACAWRREHGALHDLGPHAFDLLEAAMGPIDGIAGAGDPRRWVTLACTHASGAVSELSLTGAVELPRSVFRLDLYGPRGTLAFDAVAASDEDPWPAVRATFAAAVRSGRSPECDVHRGVRLQALIERAGRALG